MRSTGFADVGRVPPKVGTFCEQTFHFAGHPATFQAMSEWDMDESSAFGEWEGQSLSARAMAARPAPYLDALNPAQREAVEMLDGPVLVLAGFPPRSF